MKTLLSLLMCLWLVVLAPANAQGQTALQDSMQGPPVPSALSEGVFGPGLDFGVGEAGMRMNSDEPQGSSTAIEIALILTLLSVLPALLITVTCFTRIVIVLSFVRRAMSINELPPNPVLIGLALFLTSFVMGPILTNIYNAAWVPYQAEELTASEASDVAWDELSGFLLANTRQSEIELFEQIASGSVFAAETAESAAKTASGATAADALQDGAEAPPMRVVVPAFILSELKTAFQMGFLLFLPFLVIDIVVSSVLLSMGMFMLPPAMISTPFKILLFVMVDGWHLVISSLVTSFVA
jgi:flagellar biosynthesis protein FliP